MLTDIVRCQAYRQAILNVVKNGDVVVDFGAGTGLLSVFAAKAGASKVYAIENARISSLVEEFANRNNVGDKIEVVREVNYLTEKSVKADVLVSEWMGCMAVDEAIIWPLSAACCDLLKESGTVLPQSVQVMAVPVLSEELVVETNNWRQRYELDLGLIGSHSACEPRWCARDISEDQIKILPMQLLNIGEQDMKSGSVTSPLVAKSQFQIEKDCKINSICGWFVAKLNNQTVLDNSPGSAPTHWGQMILPTGNEMRLYPGEVFNLEIEFSDIGRSFNKIAWQFGNERLGWFTLDSADAYFDHDLVQIPPFGSEQITE